MKKMLLISAVACVALWGLSPSTVYGDKKSNLESLKALQEKTGTPLDEVAAIANIVLKNPGMVHFDERSNEYCLFSPEGGGMMYMVHFSAEPAKTSEGMMFFLDARAFVKAGLSPAELPPLPTKLGQMKPNQWYYYDGTYVEPHHHMILLPHVVMAFPVKD